MNPSTHAPRRSVYDVVLSPAPEGGYTVTVPALPDVVTEGDTRQEALDMARDAIEGYLEAMSAIGRPVASADHARVTVRSA